MARARSSASALPYTRAPGTEASQPAARSRFSPEMGPGSLRWAAVTRSTEQGGAASGLAAVGVRPAGAATKRKRKGRLRVSLARTRQRGHTH
jgi:hypothetical protein